jgi:hypothetical protein
MEPRWIGRGAHATVKIGINMGGTSQNEAKVRWYSCILMSEPGGLREKRTGVSRSREFGCLELWRVSETLSGAESSVWPASASRATTRRVRCE